MKLSTGVFTIDPTASACSPAAAVPASAKIPVPMIAPMPMQVRANGPSARFSWRSGAAASAIKSSGLLVLKRLRVIASYWLEIRFKHWIAADRDIGLVVRSILSSVLTLVRMHRLWKSGASFFDRREAAHFINSAQHGRRTGKADP